MADLSTLYVLTTPGPDIRFNDGSLDGIVDLFWIQTIQGLDGAPIRAPVDDVPWGDGGLIHTFWRGPRHIGFEGLLIVRSVGFNSSQCQTKLNTMEGNLRSALDSLIDASGTLAWTPSGGSAKSLTVWSEVPLDIQPTADYSLRTFTFGLICASPSL